MALSSLSLSLSHSGPPPLDTGKPEINDLAFLLSSLPPPTVDWVGD